MVQIDALPVVLWTLGIGFAMVMATFAWGAVKLAKQLDERTNYAPKPRKPRKPRLVETGRRDDEAA